MGGDVSGVIRLDAGEARLFETLNNVVREMDLSCELRCAGGWVRDKLLGLGSDDIDIAIDTMMGREFAENLNRYLAKHGEDEMSVAVIRSNPDQSKHLETAKVKCQGLEIDLVNLRSESYASSSRIPQVQFGTAEEDALRRDFTVNALFYNIRTGEIEDFTGKGLEDLRNKLLRTPLAAHQTFMDDPLRLMRAIRFASRLDFELHQDIVEAAASEQVKDSLKTKVSRERIRDEFEKSIDGPDPQSALQHIGSFGLLDVILDLSPKRISGVNYSEACLKSATIATNILRAAPAQASPSASSSSSSSLPGGLIAETKAGVRLGILSALVLPLRDYKTEDEKKRPVSVPEYAMGVALKRKKEAALIADMMNAAVSMKGAEKGISELSDVGEEDRVAFGLAIRKAKGHWKVSAVLSFILGLSCGRSLAIEQGAHQEFDSPRQHQPSTMSDIVSQGQSYVASMVQAAVSLKLDRAWEVKPLLNGKEVMQIMGAKGPLIGKTMASMMGWQMAHPEASKENCVEWLRARATPKMNEA